MDQKEAISPYLSLSWTGLSWLVVLQPAQEGWELQLVGTAVCRGPTKLCGKAGAWGGSIGQPTPPVRPPLPDQNREGSPHRRHLRSPPSLIWTQGVVRDMRFGARRLDADPCCVSFPGQAVAPCASCCGIELTRGRSFAWCTAHGRGLRSFLLLYECSAE